MKKVHSINREALRLLTTALLLFTVCIATNAYDFRVDGIYYNVLDSVDLTCEVTHLSSSNSNYSAYQGSVEIPNAVGYGNATYTVISIGDCAFRYCAALTQVTIPESVTSIGGSAFGGCTGLTEVTIPNSVTYLSGFGGCTGLTSVTIGNGVTTIGQGAFSECTELTSLTIPESVTTIGGDAFYNCRGLMEVTIPNSVTTIGERAFYWCKGLTSATIGNGVTEIGNYTFFGCSGLAIVTIGNSVETIGSSAFEYCSGLTQVTIGNSVTKIGSYAFDGCSSLESITSLNPKPSTCGSSVFSGVNKSTCILYVPEGALGAYANASTWSSFYNIIEIEVDAIADITINGNAKATGYYTTDGKKVSQPQRGINIVRYGDGSTHKVLMK